MPALISVTNNLDTTYTLVFAAAVTWDSDGGADLNSVMRSPGDNAWLPMQIQSQTDAVTIVAINTGFTYDADTFVFLAPPAHLTAGDPFDVATPTTPIS